MKIENLLENLPASYGIVERELVQKAFQFAEKAHINQKRASGEPFINHCVAVASILADLQVPPSVVIAGLLHDTPEYSKIQLKDIQIEFGEEIMKLVDGVLKLSHLPKLSRSDGSTQPSDGPGGDALPTESITEEVRRSRDREARIETVRKAFIAMNEDIRVVLIKLADQLHNMRMLSNFPEENRYTIAKETLDIYAPLANRLGVWQLKWELEDLAFRYVEPDKYKEIAENLAASREMREDEIDKIKKQIETLLVGNNIEATVSGRPKHLYSIYRKMVSKGKPFELVRDLRGVRVIVKDIPTCYTALGIIHTHWRPIAQEFDDYIAGPKDNFYQSLHTAVIYDDQKPLEVQIRTPEMNENAEFGIAAHWRYKEDGKMDASYQQRINWLRKLMEWRQEVEDSQDFMESLKAEVFEDRVYAFTPRGDIIDLPAGSTPIDFAYYVHTEIGNRCRGAKVNGKLVTLDYGLKTGDQVTILTAKQGGPSRDWLNKNLGMVKTQRAKAKIRQWFKKQDYEQNLILGKNQLERELHRLGVVVSDVNLEEMSNFFDFKSVDDLYAAIGCGDLSTGRIINKLAEVGKQKDILLELKAPSEAESGNGVNVLGLKGILTSVARCCNPAPGDAIVGYITRGRGVTIHRQDCPNILSKPDKERLIIVSWGERHLVYPVSIEIKAYDRQGLMGDISVVLSNENINLVDIHMKTSLNLAAIGLVIEVGDIAQLSRVLTRIENIPNVLEAHRIRPG